jgi:murein L,D-transpeptidase YcbB/YkuD
MLRAYDYVDGKLDIKLEMKVIVGKALNTRTPMFREDMRYIEFSPYWNVPPSIARSEVVPKSRRDPGISRDRASSSSRVARRLPRCRRPISMRC